MVGRLRVLPVPRARPSAAPDAARASWFGDFSYSLYLIHLPLFVCLGSVLFHSELQLSIWPSFAFMAAAIPVAYVFYRMFERPAMTWSASFAGSPRSGRDAGARTGCLIRPERFPGLARRYVARGFFMA